MESFKLRQKVDNQMNTNKHAVWRLTWCGLIGRKFLTRAIAPVCCLLLGGMPALGFGQDLAIKAGRIITVNGPAIEDGVILVRAGKITAVGTGLDIPVDLRLIDASDRVVMPGIVDPHSSSGLSQSNERNAVVPFLSVVDGIDPIRSYFEESRRNGVTTAAVVPGNSTMIGGQAAIVKTAGQYVDDMLVVRSAGLKISLQPPSGSRMSHIAKLRAELERAKRALTGDESDGASGESEASESGEDEQTAAGTVDTVAESEEAAAQGSGSTAQANAGSAAAKPSPANSAMQDLLTGKTRAFVYCQNASDVGQAYRLMDEYGFSAILVLGQDCYPAAQEIAKRQTPVILDPELVFWKRDPVTREDEKISLPQKYREAGVKVLFQSNDSESRQSLGTSYFWFQAATAVSYGWSEEEAIAALTVEPAKALGIEDYVGSIAEGRDADLVILTGHPLDLNTWVETTIVDGQVVYERDEDWKLKMLLEADAK